jgi:hypothetical protein
MSTDKQQLLETASATEIILLTDATASLAARAQFATRILRDRAARRPLTTIEAADLAALDAGQWHQVLAAAMAREKDAKKIQTAFEAWLGTIATKTVTAECIRCAWQARAACKRQSAERRRMVIMDALKAADVPETDVDIVIFLIDARVQAMNTCIANRRGMRKKFDIAWQNADAAERVSRVLAKQPMKVGRRLMPGLKTMPALMFVQSDEHILRSLGLL